MGWWFSGNDNVDHDGEDDLDDDYDDEKKTMMMMKKMMMMIGRLCIQDCPTAPSEEREVVGGEVWN